MQRPQVSIGLPVYNGDKYLASTLDSYLCQTNPDFELIISDNASTDQTEAIAREYCSLDNRIRYSRNDVNLGLAANFNRAFDLSIGEYFKWGTADDVCEPTYLAKCVEELRSDSRLALVYPQTRFIDEHGTRVEIVDFDWGVDSDSPDERMRHVIEHVGHWVNAIIGVIRSKTLARTRRMLPYPGADYALLGELSLLGRLRQIPHPLFLRRIHPDASSQHAAGGTNPDSNWLARYWKPTANSCSLPRWSIYRDLFRSIAGSSLSLRQKVALSRSLLREMRWQRGRLGVELAHALRTWVSSIVRPRSRKIAVA